MRSPVGPEGSDASHPRRFQPAHASAHLPVATTGTGWLGREQGHASGAHLGATPLPDGGESELAKYLRVVRDRWFIILATFGVVVLGAALGNLLQTPIYRATGTIEIRKQAAEVVPVDVLFQLERISDQYLQTQYGLLRSPALAHRAVSDPRFVKQLAAHGLLTTGASDSATLAQLGARVHKLLSVDPVAGSRLVKVRFEAEDPWLAAAVVNSVFIHYVALREEAAVAALKRLGDEADSVRADVVQAEQALQDFVRANGLTPLLVVGSGQSENVTEERLRRLQQELTLAETEGYKAEAAFSSSTAADPALLDSDLLKNLRARIAELQGEYARLRSTFTDSFPRTRQIKSELTQLDALLAQEQRRVTATIGSQYQASTRRRQLLQTAVDEQRMLLDTLAAKAAEYDRFRRDLEGHRQLHVDLQQKRKEAAVSAALAPMDVGIIDAAVPSPKPVRPKPRRDLPLAAIVGLLLGVGLAFLREYTDPSVKGADEVAALVDAPILALIPSMQPLGDRVHAALSWGRRSSGNGNGNGGWHRIDRQVDPHSALAEAFGGLRTSVLYQTAGLAPRSLLVTSPQPGDGKTTIATNLAISLAALGHRVLLIDADIRRSSLHRVFRIAAGRGLADFLAGHLDWGEVVHADVLPGLDLLPAGKSPLDGSDRRRNPSDLLSGDGVERLTRAAKLAYDFVILDSPALFINAPDTRIVAPFVDGIVVVIRSGSTPRDLLRRTLSQIPNLAGVVLNDLDLRRLPAYYRDYDGVTAQGG